jgi:uronate dehydrogenase
VRPDSRYGVSKAFGEALGALYSDKHGMVVTCLRIGNVGPRPLDVRRLSIWISPEDLVQLFQIGLEHPDIRFEILYGASDNAASWWDNSRAASSATSRPARARITARMPRPSKGRSGRILSAMSSRAAPSHRLSSRTT